MSLTMMVSSAYVNGSVHHLYILLLKSRFIIWLFYHHLHLVDVNVFQRYNTDFSNLIVWYSSIISVNEIKVFN